MLGTANREDWKSRYRELLGELESKERDWLALNEMLRSTASRLAIAAMGRDPQVDKKLDDILGSIKSNVGDATLKQHLDALAGAVVAHEKRLAANDSIDVSGFVASLALPHADLRQFIECLESDSVATQARALKDLASAINELIESVEAKAADAAEPVSGRLLARLAKRGTALPRLDTTIENLQRRARAGTAEADLLDELATAIADALSAVDREKTELEEFLEQVTQQLAQFEQWTKWHEDEVQGHQEDSVAFGNNVETQVDGLHQDIDASTELADLKSRVQARLDSIAGQLSVFRDKEEQRRQDAAVHNAALTEEVNKLKVRTSQLARRCGDQESKLMFDTLTGVHTRYAYDRRLQEEFQRWQRHNQALVYSVWDIDFFKKVNDSCGHQAGDHLLKIVAGMLTKETRIEDFVARIGGEEFVVLFPSTPLDAAVALAERLRESIAQMKFQHNGSPLTVTVSCGLTEFREQDTPGTVYERADKALYKAKDQGRNRCITL